MVLDITELVCKVKFYLCGIIDVATRRLVGWAIAKIKLETGQMHLKWQ